MSMKNFRLLVNLLSHAAARLHPATNIKTACELQAEASFMTHALLNVLCAHQSTSDLSLSLNSMSCILVSSVGSCQ